MTEDEARLDVRFPELVKKYAMAPSRWVTSESLALRELCEGKPVVYVVMTIEPDRVVERAPGEPERVHARPCGGTPTTKRVLEAGGSLEIVDHGKAAHDSRQGSLFS